MSRIAAVTTTGLALTLVVLGLLTTRASATTPTRLTVTASTSVGVNEDISIVARLVGGNGRPVQGAVITLYQRGAVGQRPMGKARTDEKGVATFLHQEFIVAHLSLRVAFAGDGRLGSSQADADVDITGIEAQPAMSGTPSLLVKAVLFSVLGGVWITYLFAASCIFRVTKDGVRKGASVHIR